MLSIECERVVSEVQYRIVPGCFIHAGTHLIGGSADMTIQCPVTMRVFAYDASLDGEAGEIF